MSNYRVRQVLALAPLPDRQLRLLIALATWMTDDNLTVRLGFDALIETTGNVRNTVKAARRDAAAAGRLTWYQPAIGRGHLTLWTVLCLPVKGVNDADPVCDSVKGVNRAQERGSTSPEKGGQPQAADLPEPDHGLNRLAKSSGSLTLADLLRSAVPDAAEREIDLAIAAIKTKRDPRAYLRKIIGQGDAPGIISDARDQLARDDQLIADRERQQQRMAALAAAEPEPVALDPWPDTLAQRLARGEWPAAEEVKQQALAQMHADIASARANGRRRLADPEPLAATIAGVLPGADNQEKAP